MGAISGTHLMENELGSWDDSYVAFIRKIEYRPVCDGDGVPVDTELILQLLAQPRSSQPLGWPDPAADFWTISIRFLGIRDLSIDSSGEGDIQVAHFRLDDISERHWEDIKIEVEDEDGAISFYAKLAEILSCAKAGNAPRCYPLSREYPLGYEPE